MAAPQAGTPGTTFKQKAKGSRHQQGHVAQAATRTGASGHLGSLPAFAFGFQGNMFQLFMPWFIRSSLQPSLAEIPLKALWMGGTQQQQCLSVQGQ